MAYTNGVEGKPQDEPYGAIYFAKKYGFTLRDAKFIIAANGPSRRMCDAAAAAFVRNKAARFKKWLR
ncbi:hypothetical protein [Mesorhizobium helmanticense]|uniref:DUF3606 domain-containing protein n=1 Tax=Mesorhizobium helmanticense TaxID=1776423 RepID=A0A2T4ISB2_9HYPH|nr:hypothetical protein [Mesorhizobium helmanticense]PTE08495.1 hypothetical protein C9427_21235 [Mesorhizobium helmanticense]